MKLFITALLAAVLVSGCGVELLTTTAIQGDLQAKQLQAMKGQVANVSNSTGRINLEHAIQVYKAEKGGNPATLEELVPNYVPSVPKHADGTPYGYDSATGTVLDGPVAPAAPAGAVTPQDMQTMQAIRDAINRYGTAVGYYPGTLDALCPTYLGKPPRTSAGESFLYNNQNGAVTHPRQGVSAAPAPQAARPTGGVGGAGPMGEVMTGIGMQQQLNSNSNAGASSAQGYMNRSLQQSTGGQNDRQNAAMDQLGL
jgi:hypothetical protein